MKIAVVFGTRPELIKLAPVILELEKNKAVDRLVINSGQHAHLTGPLMDLFGIRADLNLRVMTDGQTLATLTAKLCQELGSLFQRERPDIVVVQGDTTTAMSAALCAFYAGIPVAHVEAGLRTGDFRNPFPEEFNRVAISKLAKFHFAATERNRKALEEERTTGDLLVTGNTVIDALRWVLASRTPRRPPIPDAVLITFHRRESFGEPLLEVCDAIESLAEEFPDRTFLWPVHPNPNVHSVVRGRFAEVQNVNLIEPLDYLDFAFQMKASATILSDSGGVQEEAPALGKHVFVLRETTERIEAIEAGVATLCGTSSQRIIEGVRHQLKLGRTTAEKSPFGDGYAAARIVSHLAG